jgi:hypothetical protein
MMNLHYKFDKEQRYIRRDEQHLLDELALQIDFTDMLKRHHYVIGIKNVDQLTDEEFTKSRFNSFGASDAQVLLGVAYESKTTSPKTIEELLHEKINETNDPEISKKASVRKGKELEPLIIEKINKTFNTIALKPKHTYTNSNGLSTNFDAILFEPVVDSENIVIAIRPIPVEIKVCTTFGRKNYNFNKAISEFDYQNSFIERALPLLPAYYPLPKKIEQIAEDIGIPAYYYAQMQQEIAFTNSRYGILAVMDELNWTMYYFYVPRDEDTIAQLKRIAYTEYIILAKHKKLEIQYTTDVLTGFDRADDI